jgi:hypothetical protein
MKSKPLLLRNIPEDIFLFLLKEQNRIKESRRLSQFSLERTIYGIIKDCEKFKNTKEEVK